MWPRNAWSGERASRRPPLRLLERAVDGNFCSFPALDLDPVWAQLHDDPEFQRIRSKAMACHARFKRMVELYDTTS